MADQPRHSETGQWLPNPPSSWTGPSQAERNALPYRRDGGTKQIRALIISGPHGPRVAGQTSPPTPEPEETP